MTAAENSVNRYKERGPEFIGMGGVGRREEDWAKGVRLNGCTTSLHYCFRAAQRQGVSSGRRELKIRTIETIG